MLLKIQSIFLLYLCLGCIRNLHAYKTNKKRTFKRIGDGSSKKYAESEPGFDLTDEEMTKFNIWPMGVVPYYIDQVSYDKVLRDRIRGYLDSVNGATGLSFSELLTPPTNDSASRWVFFINRKGQLSCKDHSMSDFTSSGVQKVVLGYDCMSSLGDIGQTILALAGVPAQHNAPNRDEFVQVVEANILSDKTDLFKKLDNKEWLFHDVDYDFNSAGHFSFHKYTANGGATIKPVGSHPDEIGEYRDFSESDIWKIHMLYNYITAKRKGEIDECDQLFEPGKDIFVTDRPVHDVIKPRRKPNKYLGLPDDAPQPDDNKTEEEDDNKEDDDKKEEEDDTLPLSGQTGEEEAQDPDMEADDDDTPPPDEDAPFDPSSDRK